MKMHQKSVKVAIGQSNPTQDAALHGFKGPRHDLVLDRASIVRYKKPKKDRRAQAEL